MKVFIFLPTNWRNYNFTLKMTFHVAFYTRISGNWKLLLSPIEPTCMSTSTFSIFYLWCWEAGFRNSHIFLGKTRQDKVAIISSIARYLCKWFASDDDFQFSLNLPLTAETLHGNVSSCRMLDCCSRSSQPHVLSNFICIKKDDHKLRGMNG